MASLTGALPPCNRCYKHPKTCLLRDPCLWLSSRASQMLQLRPPSMRRLSAVGCQHPATRPVDHLPPVVYSTSGSHGFVNPNFSVGIKLGSCYPGMGVGGVGWGSSSDRKCQVLSQQGHPRTLEPRSASAAPFASLGCSPVHSGARVHR